jgi:hypothetical protein
MNLFTRRPKTINTFRDAYGAVWAVYTDSTYTRNGEPVTRSEYVAAQVATQW